MINTRNACRRVMAEPLCGPEPERRRRVGSQFGFAACLLMSSTGCSSPAPAIADAAVDASAGATCDQGGCGCPASFTPSLIGSTCRPDGLFCDYLHASIVCRQGAWECSGRCDGAPDDLSELSDFSIGPDMRRPCHPFQLLLIGDLGPPVCMKSSDCPQGACCYFGGSNGNAPTLTCTTPQACAPGNHIEFRLTRLCRADDDCLGNLGYWECCPAELNGQEVEACQ